MATIPYSADAEHGEAKFFFTMACVMAALIVAGFSLNIALGRSSFGSPWLVHFHAWIMMGFVGLYVVQNALVFRDNIALHKRLGWLSVLFIPLMLGLGLNIIRYSLQQGGGPPFFDQNEFLFGNSIGLAVFAALAAWAVTARANTGWHRRLMYCAFAILTGPGVGRILPSPFLIPYAWWAAGILPSLVFIGIGMIADKRRYDAVHPAYLYGAAIVLGSQIVADLIAYSDWGIAFTKSFLVGTPGAARQMQAFFPPS